VDTIKTYTLAELHDLVSLRGKHRFVVEDLLFSQSLVVVSGDSKVGKSVMLTSLAVSIASGAPWLGRGVSQGPVLWLAYEESDTERNWNFAQFEGFRDLPIRVCFGMPPIDTVDGLKWIKDQVVAIQPALIVIDPLAAACLDIDFDTVGSGRNKLSGLKRLIDEFESCAIVVHHLNKGLASGRSRVAGSHQILAAASGDWLVRLDALEPVRRYTLKITQRMLGTKELQVVSHSICDFRDAGPSHARHSRSAREKVLESLAGSPSPLSQRDLIQATGLSQSAVSKALSKLSGALTIDANNGERVFSIGQRGAA
jgi:hypothetical protein